MLLMIGGTSDMDIRSAYFDRIGRWWIGRDDGAIDIYHYDTKVYQWKHPSIRSRTI